MSEALVTQAQLEGLLRRLRALETRVGRTEVQERGYYATGSFTPTLIGLTTAGSLTYDTNETFAEWTRIGNRVLFNGRVRFTAIGTPLAGLVVITGFPYASATLPVGNQPAGGATMLIWTLDLPAGYAHVTGRFVEGETQLRLTRNGDNAGAAGVQGGEVVLVGGVADFQFEGQYRVA